MSADNWGRCPKCLAKLVEDREKAVAAAKAKYGKVPEDEYMAAITKANAIPEKLKEETLREDYEIGTDEDGEFSVSYHCSCRVCNFDFRFAEKRDALTAQGKAVKKC